MRTHSMGNVAQLLTTCFDCGSEATLEQLDYDQNVMTVLNRESWINNNGVM
jgi:hypothetical protein